MSERFVVVIEVNNQRALAAYKRGLVDLDLLWPQLMEHAQAVDDKRKERYNAAVEKHENDEADRKARWERYERDLKEWTGKTMFRGSRPESPDFWGLSWASRPYPPNYLRSTYEGIREDLKRIMDLAGAAVAPYRMTEYQVKEMIGWEDGSRIEQLKAQMASKEEPMYYLPW